METGLFLNGKIVASDIKTGTRKEMECLMQGVYQSFQQVQES